MSPLDKVVREARGQLGTEQARGVDWDAVERGLFERVAQERLVERARFVPRGLRSWPGVAVAAAAAVAVFSMASGDARRGRSFDVPSASVDEVAGSILSIEGGGQVRVDGREAAHGAALRVGSVIETRGAEVTIDRAGKLTLRIEAGSRAIVTHAQGTLVLALAEGALEAQVVPVASGEAFAVDVDGARVAVHGTHLRVAREGQQVAVDLSEGVVSVGTAPRVGSVIGALVAAPAHAEFTASDAPGTLRVTHDPASVRSPVALASAPQVRPSPLTPLPAALPKAEPIASAHGTSAVAPGSAHVDARPGSPGPQAGATEGNPDQAIAGAVRACMAERPRAENVTILVRTTLRLELGDDGSVHAARFDPPVAPDVNSCAVTSIYKAHFAHGGTEAIAIDFEN
jgi:hypothetical protein